MRTLLIGLAAVPDSGIAMVSSGRRHSSPLSTSELYSYEQDGYLIKRRLFSPEIMEEVALQIDDLHRSMSEKAPHGVHLSWEEFLPPGRPPRIRQLLHSDKVSPLIDAMSRASTILDIVELLIGPDIYLFHSKLMMKSARDGSATPWHQDWAYWRREAYLPTQVNCMVFIDRAGTDNGAIRFVSGSHRYGLQEHTMLGTKSFPWGLEERFHGSATSPLELEAGDAVFFGPLVVHGSGANLSATDRRANTFAFDRPGNRKEGTLPESRYRRGRWELNGDEDRR